jgi:uncharacterized protein YndB with AHSA1/START domain
VFEAPAEQVFDAWLDPALAGRFLFATPGGRMARVDIDPRVGGTFTIAEERGGKAAEHFGTYLEIERPRRLVFAFATDREHEPARVTLDIVPVPGGCELTLTHEMGPEWAEYRERTQAGWTMILDGLGRILATGGR